MWRADALKYILVSLIFITATAVAGPCEVANKGAKTAKFTDPKLPTIESGSWDTFQDCSSLKLVLGSVKLRGLVNGVPTSIACENKDEKAEPKACGFPPTSKSIVVSSTSKYEVVAGGHRMGKDVVLKAGMPKGEIFSLENAAKFDFTSLTGAAISFTLGEAKKKIPVFTARVTDGTVQIPKELLSRGTKYAWEVYGIGNKRLAAGGFNLMTDNEASKIEGELAKLEQAGERTEAETLLDELAVFQAYDLTYETEVLRQTLVSSK